MKRIDFDCTFDLAEEIISLLDKINEDYPVVSVYGGYDVIKYLLEDLIMSGVAISESIELESYVIDHYDKEFVLYITEDGASVCKCWKYDGYLNGSGDISFVHEDCSSKLLKHIDSKMTYEFGIIDYDGDEECDCDECACSCKEKDDVATASTASYTVNGKPVSKAEFERKYADFKNNYLNSVRDMVTNYYEFIDEINEWAKIFRW